MLIQNQNFPVPVNLTNLNQTKVQKQLMHLNKKKKNSDAGKLSEVNLSRVSQKMKESLGQDNLVKNIAKLTQVPTPGANSSMKK